MATAVHIPESEVPDVKTLLDMANEGAVVVERDGVAYQVARQHGRTLAEIFSNPKLIETMEALDEDWSKDMEDVIAMRKSEPSVDPWA